MQSMTKKIVSQLFAVVVLAGGILVHPVAAQQSQWEALNQQLSDLYGKGRYQEALPIAERALSLAEQTFGPTHLNVASSLNNLAEIYRLLNRPEQAEPLYQ